MDMESKMQATGEIMEFSNKFACVSSGDRTFLL